MTYRYTFLSLRDEQVIEEIPLFGVFCQRILNSAGQFNGSYNLDQTGKNNADLVAATIPGKTWFVVERDDTLVYWGIVWNRTYLSEAKVVNLYGWGFEAYPSRQYILTDFVRNNEGQMQLVADLWNHMQTVSGRNVNVNTLPVVNDQVIRSVNILATDRKYYGDIIDSIANATDGFDWTVQVTKQSNGIYRKDLVMEYPFMGATDPSALVFEYPGAILNYWQSEGMSESGTHIFGFGSGEGSDQLVSLSSWDDLVAQGWPRWDIGVSMKDIADQATLNGLTAQEAIKRKPPMGHYTIQLAGNADPVFGSYSLGDNVYLAIKDCKHPEGLMLQTRIIGFELSPPDETTTEMVKLILPGDSVAGQTPSAAQI